MDSVKEHNPSVSFEVPMIWCSSCKEKTENTNITHTTCKGKTEDKERVSIKAQCGRCNKNKHTFHKNQSVNVESEVPIIQEQDVKPKPKKKVPKKKPETIIEEQEPRITLTLSQLASFLNCKF